MSNIYTVGQVNAYIRNMFTQDFLLHDLTVRGEVSNYKDHPSGHIYFSLKDQDAVLAVVMFAGSRAKGLKTRLRDGQKVIVRGSVSIYEAAGRYQLYAKEISDDGEGELYREFLKLKERLEEMGMFDPAYKKPLPKFALTVGVVTSSSGAALRDIMQITARRNPYVQLILSPALVQGEQAADSIVEAIERLDRIHPDIMIVGRGGGSQEDLWVFNDERVARAIFDADTPVISAVGHEVDFTIADFVADHRAPTPSAAAELAVFDAEAYLSALSDAKKRMEFQLERQTERLKSSLEGLKLRLKLNHPEAQLRRETERLGILTDTLYRDIREILKTREERLVLLSERLNGRSPLLKLKNGYGYISLENRPLRSAQETKPGQRLKITVSDGKIDAEVLGQEFFPEEYMQEDFPEK